MDGDIKIDTSAPHMARVYDYLLGGHLNFAVDRALAEHVTAVMPGGIDGARANVRANRAFLAWAIEHLAAVEGIRQFLDIGTGIPNADNVHAVAQQAAPDSSVVYVDHDPIVLAHAKTLLDGTAEGATDYIDGDIREPESILRQAERTIDFAKPVAVILVGILHYVRDDENPYDIVKWLVAAVPSGSYLVVSHLASDIHGEQMAQASQRHNAAAPVERTAFRTRDEVRRFFDGLVLMEPCVAPLDDWHQLALPRHPTGQVIPIYGAIGRKP